MAVELKLENQPDEAVRALLNETTLGTPGGIQYKHLNVDEKLDELKDTRFLSLRLRNRTLGTLSLTRRIFEHDGLHPLASDYIRYLSIKSLMRNEKSHRTKKKTQPKKNNSTQRLVSEFFNNYATLKGLDIPASSDYIMYAFVDAHNERSANLVEKNGFKPYRKFKTSAYNNFFPKKQPEVKPLDLQKHGAAVKSFLYQEYADHSLYHPALIELDQDYWIFEQDGTIIAGVKVRPATWKIVNLPGVIGSFLLKLLPNIPLLKRHFNPTSFKFLALEGILLKDGYEGVLPKLLEGICYEYQQSIAMFWFDTESKLFNRIQKISNMGFLRKVLKFKPASLYIKSDGLSEQTEKFLKETPTYISASDVI